MEKLYSIKEFTEALGISRDTFYTWKSKGIIKPIKIGGTVRIPESQVQQLLKQEENTGG